MADINNPMIDALKSTIEEREREIRRMKAKQVKSIAIMKALKQKNIQMEEMNSQLLGERQRLEDINDQLQERQAELELRIDALEEEARQAKAQAQQQQQQQQRMQSRASRASRTSRTSRSSRASNTNSRSSSLMAPRSPALSMEQRQRNYSMASEISADVLDESQELRVVAATRQRQSLEFSESDEDVVDVEDNDVLLVSDDEREEALYQQQHQHQHQHQDDDDDLAEEEDDFESVATLAAQEVSEMIEESAAEENVFSRRHRSAQYGRYSAAGSLPFSVAYYILRHLDERTRHALACVALEWNGHMQLYLQEMQRRTACKELLEMEREYMRTLHTAMFQYRGPLMKRQLLVASKGKVLFSGIGTLLKMHSTMYTLLAARYRDWHPQQTVGDVLSTLAPAKRLYTMYEKSFHKRSEMLQFTMNQNLDLAAFCANVQLKGFPPLSDALAAPLGHLLQLYKCALSLKEKTPFDHADRETLTEVVELLSETLESSGLLADARSSTAPSTAANGSKSASSLSSSSSNKNTVASAKHRGELPESVLAQIQGQFKSADAPFVDSQTGRPLKLIAYPTLLIGMFEDGRCEYAFSMRTELLNCVEENANEITLQDGDHSRTVQSEHDVAAFVRVLKALRFGLSSVHSPVDAEKQHQQQMILHEGWLQKKKPGRLQAARRRYFMLGRNTLAYYTAEPPHGELLARIKLEEVTVFLISEAPAKMLIKAEGRNDSIVYPTDDDDEVLRMWLQEIRNAKELCIPGAGNGDFQEMPDVKKRGSVRPTGTWRRKKGKGKGTDAPSDPGFQSSGELPKMAPRDVQSTWRRKKPKPSAPRADNVFEDAGRDSGRQALGGTSPPQTEREPLSPRNRTETMMGKVSTVEMRMFLMEVAETHEKDLEWADSDEETNEMPVDEPPGSSEMAQGYVADDHDHNHQQQQHYDDSDIDDDVEGDYVDADVGDGGDDGDDAPGGRHPDSCAHCDREVLPFERRELNGQPYHLLCFVAVNKEALLAKQQRLQREEKEDEERRRSSAGGDHPSVESFEEDHADNEDPFADEDEDPFASSSDSVEILPISSNICRNCDKELKPTSQFCTQCGQKVSRK